MKIRFNDDDSVQSKFLGEGQHEVRVTKIDDKPSKKGMPMLTIEFTADNGKTCIDWFVLEFKKKLYGLALAAGATPEILKSGEWDSAELFGKRIMLIRTTVGKRSYTDKDGNPQEADNFENSYLPLENKSFTDSNIPF